MKMKIVLSILAFLMFTSCNTSISSSDSITAQLSVSLILDSSQQRQKAFITFINSPNENIPVFVDSAYLFIEGIRFELIPSDSMYSNFYCRHRSIGIKKCYNYFSDSLSLIGDKVYNLILNYKDIHIKGTTLFPGDFSFGTSGKKIFWTESKNAISYRITVTRLFGEQWEWNAVTSKLNIVINDKGFIEGPYNIRIEAIDKNFYNFYKKIDLQAGLLNAYGVFGSVMVKEKNIYLR